MGISKKPSNITHSTLFNLAGVLIPTIVQLATVPLYIHAIGAERYGVMTLVWLLLGYFGIFDLGFGKAIANQIAILVDATEKARQDVFWTGTCFSVATGLIGGLILYAIAMLLFGRVLAVPNGMLGETKTALPLLIVALPVVTGISALGGALQGREAFGVFNLSQLTGSILYQIFPMLVAVFLSPNLPGLIAAAIFGRVVTLGMLYGFCLTNIPAHALPYIKRDKIRGLLGYGGWVALMGLINPLLTVFDRFVIGAITGMSAVAAYTIPYNLVLRIGALPSALQNALFPRFSMSEEKTALALLLRAIFALASILTPILVIGMMLIKPFLKIWLGKTLAGETSAVGEILLVGLWSYSTGFIPGSYLQSRGRPDIEPKLALGELLFYAPALYWSTLHFGVIGAAWAWSARTFVDTILKLGAIGILKTSVQIWFGMVLLAVVWAWVFPHIEHSAEYWFINLALLIITSFWSIQIMPAEIWHTVAAKLRGVRFAPIRSPPGT